MGFAGAILSAGVNMASANASASAIQEEGAYQKRMLEENANLAELQGRDAIERGDKEARRINAQGRRIGSAQRAAYSSQGVDVNSGVAAEMVSDTVAAADFDALTVKTNAWREAWGLKEQATDYRERGRLVERAAKNKAGATLLTGGLSAVAGLGKGAYDSFSRMDWGGDGDSFSGSGGYRQTIPMR